MAHIYLYSPASCVRDKRALRRGIARLKALGHEVEIDPAALAQHMRFAGDDATRIAAIGRAAASGAAVALTTRGGYGLTRLLPALPYKAIARATQRGMHWLGVSDFTAFQLAALAKTGTRTWAGPALLEDFGAETAPDDIMLACFDDLLTGRGEGTGWRLPAPPRARRNAAAGTPNTTKMIVEGALSTPKYPETTINDAPLWGGNLSLLTSLLGTPFFPSIDAGVLFVEDVAEHPYRIERMLTQLLHAGVLARQKALLLGRFTGYKAVPGYDRGFGLASVAQFIARQCPKLAVLTGLPFGHVPTKVLLPVGTRVDLAVQDRQVLLVWGHL